jgi:hypothetical protein
MDHTKPIKQNKNFYIENYYKASKSSFLSLALDKCKDKEEPTQCLDKLTKAYDIVFNSLNEKLLEDDLIHFRIERRMWRDEESARILQLDITPASH